MWHLIFISPTRLKVSGPLRFIKSPPISKNARLKNARQKNSRLNNTLQKNARLISSILKTPSSRYRAGIEHLQVAIYLSTSTLMCVLTVDMHGIPARQHDRAYRAFVNLRHVNEDLVFEMFHHIPWSSSSSSSSPYRSSFIIHKNMSTAIQFLITITTWNYCYY